MGKISGYPTVTSMGANDLFLIDTFPITNNSTSIITRTNALASVLTNPMSASGDTIYGGSSGTPTRLAKGTNGQVLTLNSGLPAWQTPSANVQTVFNVVSFGATGNGSTDDTTAVQAAINAANAAGGGTVSFPTGTYKISAVLTLFSGVSLLGYGALSSIINQTSTTAHGVTFTSGSLANATLSIQALGISGPTTGSGNGINMAGEPLVYVSIRDVAVQNFGATGIYLGGSIVSTLERTTSTTNGLHGFWIDGTNSFVTSTSLINCYANDNPAAGYYFFKATYCSLDGCASDSNGIGYLLSTVSAFSANGSGAESSQSHSVSGYPGVSWKIIGDNVIGTAGVALNGCYSYDVHDIGYWITGTSVGVTLTSCADNTPHSGATASLQVDSAAIVSILQCDLAGTVTVTGALSNLGDPALSYQYLRNVYANTFIATDSPTSIGTSNSNILMTASGGANFIESVGVNNSGAAALTIGSQFLGVEYVGFSAAGTATFPNAVVASGGITMADATNLAVGTTTGTKIGTATTQKLGLWNVAPVVQPQTAGTTTGFTAVNTSTVVAAASTFTGNTGTAAYTVGDIVLALKQTGIMKA